MKSFHKTWNMFFKFFIIFIYNEYPQLPLKKKDNIMKLAIPFNSKYPQMLQIMHSKF